jgi:hypothetical protein
VFFVPDIAGDDICQFLSAETSTEFIMFIHSNVPPPYVYIIDGFTIGFSFFTNNYATRVFCLCSLEDSLLLRKNKSTKAGTEVTDRHTSNFMTLVFFH